MLGIRTAPEDARTSWKGGGQVWSIVSTCKRPPKFRFPHPILTLSDPYPLALMYRSQHPKSIRSFSKRLQSMVFPQAKAEGQKPA